MRGKISIEAIVVWGLALAATAIVWGIVIKELIKAI